MERIGGKKFAGGVKIWLVLFEKYDRMKILESH